MKLNHLPVGPLGVNCILLNDDSNNLMIIDPGGDTDKIACYIDARKFTPHGILFTHGHFDHIGAARDLQTRYCIPISVHKLDESLLAQGPSSASYFGFPGFPVPKADDYLEDGQEIEFGGALIKVLHTPGHTAGSVSFYIPESGTVLTGDTLFREGIGRTDFPGSSSRAIFESIRTKLCTLNDNTVVYPGHGPITTIGHEKEFNPYLRGSH